MGKYVQVCTCNKLMYVTRYKYRRVCPKINNYVQEFFEIAFKNIVWVYIFIHLSVYIYFKANSFLLKNQGKPDL